MFVYFALLHAPSGNFITRPRGRNGRGGSHVEPGPGHPRLFTTRRSAAICLSQWLRGKHVADRWHGYDHEGYPDSEERIVIIPIPERRREDVTIVSMTLTRSEV